MPSDTPHAVSAAVAEPELVDGQRLKLGELSLTVRVSTRRGRLGLTVERDGEVTLRAPVGCGVHRAMRFVQEHETWLVEKARLRDRFHPAHPVRDLVDGTVFRYLGREYPLLLADGEAAGARLWAGRLRLDRRAAADPARGRAVIVGWYRKTGVGWAHGRLQPWADRMGVPEPAVEVRDLGRRWGAYWPGRHGGHGRMALHWAAFQLPIRLVDYLIAHELAHIRVSGHGPDYWRLLRRAIPECERRKEELDEMGRRVWLGEVRAEPTRSEKGTPHG